MRRNNIQRRQVQPELASLGELADHSPDRQEVRSRDRHSQVCQLEGHVVNAGSVESEDESLGLVFGWSDEVVEGATSVVRQLGEDCSSRGISSSSNSVREAVFTGSRLFFCQLPHFGLTQSQQQGLKDRQFGS